MGSQHLDRDRAALWVQREVHDAHPALADLLDEAVGPDALPVATVVDRPAGLRHATRARTGSRG
jgi:hypothetical protein